MNRLIVLAAVSAAFLTLMACTEQPQTAGTRKADSKAWEGTNNAFAASGWKAGDKEAWEEQIRNRAQAQNEYTRAK
ncbi:MAG: hypothetical protein WA210_00035 [Burkholderiaceae bacterium]